MWWIRKLNNFLNKYHIPICLLIIIFSYFLDDISTLLETILPSQIQTFLSFFKYLGTNPKKLIVIYWNWVICAIVSLQLSQFWNMIFPQPPWLNNKEYMSSLIQFFSAQLGMTMSILYYYDCILLVVIYWFIFSRLLFYFKFSQTVITLLPLILWYVGKLDLTHASVIWHVMFLVDLYNLKEEGNWWEDTSWWDDAMNNKNDEDK